MLEPVKTDSALYRAFNRVPFIMQIVIGLVIGILIAIVYPHDTSVIPTFGRIFVSALKALAPILVFVLVAAAIARHTRGQPNNMKTVLYLYFIDMLIAGSTALTMSYLFPSTFSELAQQVEGIESPQTVSVVLLNFINQAVQNPISALISGNYIAILVWAVAFGLMFRVAHDNTKRVLDDLSECVSGVVRIVIRFAPLGVMGLVYSSCTQDGGFSNLLNYLHVVMVIVITIAIIAFVLNAVLVYLVIRENPFPLIFTCVTKSGVTAFFTRSSAANIPVNLQLCEDLKLPRETYSISIPLGCTINMAGAGVTIVIMTMATVNTLGIQVDLMSTFLMCIVSVLCACGSSGIAGGSLMLIPLACSLFGIGNDIAMQVVGIGFIIGVLQDSAETALNSSTDVLLTAAACKRAERLAAAKGNATGAHD
ncbi:MAG: serine/threonine transporter SstT [Succinivibrionaceae bacterium]|nr:serine/threonine transporter SstT [Succinivibrionaceae bacterium]